MAKLDAWPSSAGMLLEPLSIKHVLLAGRSWLVKTLILARECCRKKQADSGTNASEEDCLTSGRAYSGPAKSYALVRALPGNGHRPAV